MNYPTNTTMVSFIFCVIPDVSLKVQVHNKNFTKVFYYDLQLTCS